MNATKVASACSKAQHPGLRPEALQEVIEVRAAMEGLNARRAANHPHARMLAEFRALLDTGRSARRDGDIGALARVNTLCHRNLALAGRNPVLWELMCQLRERTEPLFAHDDIAGAAAAWDDHAYILAAIIDGDGELAQVLVKGHVERAARAAARERTHDAAIRDAH